MQFPNTVVSWVVWFYDTFIYPLIRISKSTDVLGYPLFNWIFGLSVVALAVNFIRALFVADGKD